MDSPDLSGELLERIHSDLAIVHKVVGTFGTIERVIRNGHRPGDRPIRRVLDIGCGGGDLLRHLRDRLNVEVIGVDLRPGSLEGIPVVTADATCDLLPEADVAISSLTAHHLTPEENVAMIRNVTRSSPRFVIHDLVRHPLPLTLFRLFVAPLLGKEAASDGQLSVRRAYMPEEFDAMIREAMGSKATWTIDVSPFRSRQIADIRL